jgi:hypothetical protein
MAQHYSLFEELDFSNERSSAKIYNGAITALTIAGFLTEFAQMRAAIAGITGGVMASESWIGDHTVLSNIPPTSEFAQREVKWLVRYIDTVTSKKYTLTLPCANPTGRLVTGTDIANLGQTEIAAFVTRFESFARCPDSDANAVEVQSLQFVGRNT